MRTSTRLLVLVMVACVSAGAAAATAREERGSLRLKDLGRLQGWRENALVGYGIVTGLAGTGDSPTNRITRQTLSNVLSRFNLTVPPEQVQSRNVAVVMVTANLSTFARAGDTLDVSVTSAGDARSLLGGSLMLTPLSAPNGRTFALAQGAVLVGGYRYDANGNVVQKNHPTVGSVPGGATVEAGVAGPPLGSEKSVIFVLNEPDFTTAQRVAEAIDRQLGAGTAEARDGSGIEIQLPEKARLHPVAFFAGVENVSIEPDRRAKVVINERTGTVVAGGDVRISKVAISHGDIKISITTTNTASQPTFIGQAGPGVRTALLSNTRIDASEEVGTAFVSAGSTTVADLVQSLSKLKTSTRDIISILRAVKAAGALHAELIVQ